METKNHAVITLLDILSRFPLCLLYIKDHEIKKTTFSFGIFGNYSKGGQPMFKLWSFFTKYWYLHGSRSFQHHHHEECVPGKNLVDCA